MNNKVIDDVYVGNITPWNCWCDADYCKICGKGPLSTTFEFHYIINGVEKYAREACLTCTRNLVKQDTEYNDVALWKKSIKEGKNTYSVFLRYGIIDDLNITI